MYISISIYLYIYTTHIQSAQILQKQDGYNTYVIMKTMCSPIHHQNGFVQTKALRHMMYVMYIELLHCI